MSVRILLDRPHAHFTNLDFITGKVLFTLPIDSTISSIVVKLEGESRSRLSGPRYPGSERPDKKKTELEVHKVSKLPRFCRSIWRAPGKRAGFVWYTNCLPFLQLLYQVLTLFPKPEVAENAPPNPSYTMLAGTYEYTFKFKVSWSCYNLLLIHVH